MNCLWCGSSSLRTSRLHFLDLARLSILQYPVRCRECDERFFTNVFRAFRLNAATKARRMARRNRKSAAQ